MDIINPQENNNTNESLNQEQKLGYIYRHIRLDKNEVFYIGKGTNTNGQYYRSKEKSSRNPHWHNIVNKTEYDIEIMLDELTEDEANKKEVELILLYGRLDLGTGTLVNMTDGGDGVSGSSEETRKKQSESAKGRKCLNPHNKDPEKIRKMAEKHRGMKRSEESRKRMSDAKQGMIAKNRKLSNDDVRKIREDYKNNVEVTLISEFGITLVYKSAFCKEYGKVFNVTVPCIRNIIDNKTYKDVK